MIISNAKKIIYVLLAVLILFLGFWIYNNLFEFEVDRELVFQCQDNDDGEWEEIFTYFANINDICNEYPEFKSKIEKKMGCRLEEIDTKEYRFLKVCGGEIESFKMVKNTKNWYPNIKYKKGVAKNTISIYLMKRDRYIETDI